MRELRDFRIYYNHTIHPELMRLERKRKRLFLLLIFSGFFFFIIILIEIYLNILVITLLLTLGVIFYISYLLLRIRQFILTFKPNVVNLILDFIDDSLNYQKMTYEPKKYISKADFLESNLFHTPAPVYEGEDYIEGKIGDIDFRLCELNVREFSKVRNRLNYVFRGVFLHAVFTIEAPGTVMVWPRKFQQYLTPTLREISLMGGRNVDNQIRNAAFKKTFISYAMPDTIVAELLSRDMQRAILDYQERTGKDIYLSFVESQIFMGVTNPKDILEPYVFRSNVSFEMIREFFEDISMLISIVEDFDANH
ncbi:MAG: DUF3137 domain-containing protein [Saprospiraceae bacterium]